MGEQGTYGGAIGAFPYAFRVSDSRIFRTYVVVSGVLAALLVVFFVLALPGWVAATLGQSAVVALSRAFLILIWLAVVAPLIAPVLVVARRHRLGRPVTPRYDAAMAVAGYLFVVSVYAGLLIAAPAGQRGTPTGVVAPVVEMLYALPRPAGAVPPIAVVALMVAIHRILSQDATAE